MNLALDRAPNIKHLSTLPIGRRRHCARRNTEELALICSKGEALAVRICLALLLAISTRFDVCRLAQGCSVLVAACGCGSAGVTFGGLAGLLALRICVASVCIASVCVSSRSLLGAGIGIGVGV